MQVDTLADYLSTYAETLIEKVESSSRPLHCDSARPEVKLLREPMPAQWDRIGAIVSSWKAKRYGMILSAEMGTGKTICAIVSTHLHAGSKPYRALVVCPPHLQEKWVREIKMTLPSVKCIILESYRDLLKLKGTKATGPEWVIISGNKAKMASSWIPAYTKKHSGILHCPNCHEAIERKVKSQGADVMVPASHWDLEKQQSFCPACGNAHFQWTHEFDRWPIANLVSRQARKVFGYLILDEAHEAKGERSSIGLATGKLASAIRYKLALTGTLLNGYADSVLPLCYRFFPSKIKALDVAWGDTMGFTKRYGRLETIISFKDSESYANRQSRGGGRTTTTRVRPGIVPSLYGDCLLENTVFCSLEDLNFKLPGCAEVLHPVQMDEELAENYDHIEREIKSSLRSMIAAGSKAAISILLNTLSGWPDHPYGFNSVGYFNSVGQWVHVTEPPELDQGTLRNKERKLLELVKDSVARGRQVWIYVEMTVKRDIQVRLESLLKAEGLDVRVLRSSTVKASEREEWIRQNATANVVISNPALVKTGLDLFDRSGAYNFSTLIFYQTGYQLDTLRQAAARSNRIGQWLECEVHYLFYADTMQESCVSLMAQKTNAAQAIEGKLTTSGLAASIEIEASAAMALAKMLIAKNDTQRVARPSVPVASCLPGVTVPTAQILSKSEPIPLPIQSPSRPMSHSSQVQPQYVVTEARMKQWVHQANAIRQAFTTVAQGSKARQMLKQLAKCLELLAQEERLKVESAMDWGNLCQLAQTTQVPLRAVRLEPAGA